MKRIPRSPTVVRGVAAAVLIVPGITGLVSAQAPMATKPKGLLEAAVESLLADPEFAKTIFDEKAIGTPVDEAVESEPVAGDGGKMPAVESTSNDEVVGVNEPKAIEDDGALDLSPELIELRAKVRRVLGFYYRRHLNTRDHTPWEIFHQIIAYGDETKVRQSGPKGAAVDAVAWLCGNRPAHGQQLLYLERGRLLARRGKEVQGHFGQFLAILAQRGVALEYPLQVSGKSFTVADLVRSEQLTCRKGEELTFKLIAFMHYLGPGAQWKNDQGQTWTIERVLRDEIDAPIRTAACGGTHRLMGISYAVRKRQELEQPFDGQYGRARTYLRDYHRYTFGLQNDDGSFSTEWFKGRGNRPDQDRRLQTSGHTLEWLAYSVPVEYLRDPRMVKAIDYVSTLLDENHDAQWEIGPLGHGLHALALYDERVFVAAENEAAAIATKQGIEKRMDDPPKSVDIAPENKSADPGGDEVDEGGPESARTQLRLRGVK